MSYLDIIQGKENAKIVYEDDIALAFAAKNGSTIGEVVLVPKKKYPIMEQIPDDEMSHLAILSRKISDVCFETLSGKGTNILIQNGIPAGQTEPLFSIRILPRRENDNLNFRWSTEKESESELSSIKEIISSETQNIFISKVKQKYKEIKEPEKKSEENKEEKKEEGKPINPEEGDIDYRLDFFKNKKL